MSLPVQSAAVGAAIPPWWQILGAFLLVIALLVLFLRLLGRLQGGGGGGREARLLETHGAGPGRSVEVLRFRDKIHTLYRHDGACVLLETSEAAAYAPPQRPQPPIAGLGERLTGLLRSFRRP